MSSVASILYYWTVINMINNMSKIQLLTKFKKIVEIFEKLKWLSTPSSKFFFLSLQKVIF